MLHPMEFFINGLFLYLFLVNFIANKNYEFQTSNKRKRTTQSHL